MRAQQAAAQQAARRNRLIGVIAGVVVVALIVTLVVVLSNRGKASPINPGASSAPVGSLPAGQIAPPSADPTWGWLELKSDNVKPDAVTVDIHFDYQCSFCGLVERPYAPVFQQLIASGDIVYRAHIRTLIGDQVNDWSKKAAVAATCADVVGSFLAYNQVAYDNQPPEWNGFTDDQLRNQFASQAGITGDKLTTFQACYDQQQTMTFVKTMESNNFNSTTINFGVAQSTPVRSTPAIFVNGKPLNNGLLIDVGQANSTGGPLLDTSTPDALLALLRQTASGS